MKISILTVSNHPFSGFVVREIQKKLKIFNIIFDKKGFSKRDLLIWSQRTSGKINYYDIKSTNLLPKDYVSNHNNYETLKLIKENQIELLINIGTPRILKEKIINAPSIGILNCHPGILPNYRGCSCVEWALYNNDPVGNTCHLMSKKIDSGPIINSKKLDIKRYKNYVDIRVNLYLNSINLIINAIKLLKKKNISSFKTKTGGQYYKPIDNKKFNEVLKKYNIKN